MNDWFSMTAADFGREAAREVSRAFAVAGFERYEPVTDQHGIDLVVRRQNVGAAFRAIQVKGVRWRVLSSKGTRGANPYVFVTDNKMSGVDYVVVVLVTEAGILRPDPPTPEVFLVPDSAWKGPGVGPRQLLTHRTYAGLRSAPEYGINIAKRHMPALRRFSWSHMIGSI
jgi:hypothetical protein